MKEYYKPYATRIASASPLQMVLINYELLQLNINKALACQKEEKESRCVFIYEAKDFLMLLMKSLDMNVSLSYDLMRLYLYVNKLLNLAYYAADAQSYLEDSIKILKELYEGFEQISTYDKEEPVMDNSQTLYAGLTYSGRGKKSVLNEYVPEETSRGFKA